ncbi:hypothetical protein COOONC_10972 [Cooperia oncophora]
MSPSSSETEHVDDVAKNAQSHDLEELQAGNVDGPARAPVNEERYLNVVISVPDDVVDEFYFGDRLPDEIRQLFPELVNARVCIVEPFIGQKRFLSLHIPVIRPPEADAKADRLLSVPIYV